MLPWNEDELALETSQLCHDLVDLNRNGVLTINSQPHVNAAKSNDPVFGWGGDGGYVYQKVCFITYFYGIFTMEMYKTVVWFSYDIILSEFVWSNSLSTMFFK